jgi:hypothetical protein
MAYSVPKIIPSDPEDYFNNSKTLRTSAHRQMVMNFIRELSPQAILERIYDASVDGWSAEDFHRCCDEKGYTITIV